MTMTVDCHSKVTRAVRQCGVLVISTRVSTLGDDVVHGWDPAVCAVISDWDGIMLASAMAERALGKSLPAVAGAVSIRSWRQSTSFSL